MKPCVNSDDFVASLRYPMVYRWDLYSFDQDPIIRFNPWVDFPVYPRQHGFVEYGVWTCARGGSVVQIYDDPVEYRRLGLVP